MISIFIAWLIEFVYSLSSEPTWGRGVSVFCILWFASGAAFFIGTIMGFIFGFPKARTKGMSASGYGDNTNLEEVSDWLTKIIVGIGISQFTKLVALISTFGETVARSMTPTNIDGSKSIAIARLQLLDEFLRRFQSIAAVQQGIQASQEDRSGTA